MANRCARCISAWNKIPLDRRLAMSDTEKRPYNRLAITTVGGVPVCAGHVDDELAKVGDAREAESS